MTSTRTLTGKPLDPRRRTPARPYAGKRGVLSVTTVLDALGKPGLPWGAARETAIFAVLHREEWESLAEVEAIDRLRKHHRGLWDGRAAMGTLVHRVNEAWTWGETADVDELVRDIAAEKAGPKIWRGQEDVVVDDAAGYIDGLERFWTDFAPVTVATEEVVRFTAAGKSYEYIGQRDWVAEIDGKRLLLDIKTTARQLVDGDDLDQGTYFDSWRLQLAAYALANEIVDYDADGNETGTHPNYPVEGCAVLHLRGDGAYTLWQVQAGAEEQSLFLRLVDIHRWLTDGHKKPPSVPRAPKSLADQLAASIPTKEKVA